jgi:hypothetical protein
VDVFLNDGNQMLHRNYPKLGEAGIWLGFIEDETNFD